MIQTSSAFATANAALAKKPTYAIRIEGYSRVFAYPSGIGTVPPLPTSVIVQLAERGNGPSGPQPGNVTLPNATPAGNILFAFLKNGDGGSSPAISDTAGNTWTALYLGVPQAGGDGIISIWYATAVASGPGNQVTFTTGAFRQSSAFYVVEVPAAYSGFLYTHTTANSTNASATTSDGDVLSVPLTLSGAHWDLFEISLSPILPLGFLCIGFSSTSPADPAQLIGTPESFTFLVTGAPAATVEDWLISIDDLKLTVSDLDGGANLADLIFTVQDYGHQITADLATFIFEGKKVELLHGFVGMAVADYATLFTGQIDTVESANGNTAYAFTASDVNIKKLTQKIYTVGDDGFSTSSNHPHTIVAHPLDILVDALEQAGVVATGIDTAKIAFYRDTIFNGYTFTFTLTSAPTAKDFIENELCKPLGMYLWVNNLGLVSINSFYPAVSGNGSFTPPTPPVMTVTPDNIVGMVLETEADLINQVIFDFDDDGSGGSKFLAEQIVDYDVSIAKYGLVGGQTIQSQGMRSSFQGYFMAAIIGRLICLRYGLKTLVLDPLTLFWDAVTLEPGDIIAVTHPYIPDRVGGVMGVTAKAFEVMDRNWKFLAGRVELKLLAVDLSKFKQYQIAPNAEADYSAASGIDQAKYMFQCGADGKYSTGAVGNTLG